MDSPDHLPLHLDDLDRWPSCFNGRDDSYTAADQRRPFASDAILGFAVVIASLEIFEIHLICYMLAH